MKNSNKLIHICRILFIILFLTFFFFQKIVLAKWQPSSLVKLSIENSPEIGGIAVLKLVVVAGYDEQDADIGCFLPLGLELINDKGYRVAFLAPPRSSEEGNNIKFFSGAMKKGEEKEFIFKVRVSDGKRYIVGAGGCDGSDYLEIDLGDPEPPELTYYDRNEPAGIKDGQPHIKTRIKQLEGNQLMDLTIPEDSPPPLRTELKVRTRYREYYDYYRELVINPRLGKNTSIPIRYLVYTEEETPNLKATLILPKGLEFISSEEDKGDYPVSTLEDGSKEVLLYSGLMRFRQCKGFYFKVKAISTPYSPIVVTTELTTSEGKRLLKEDKLVIDLKYERRLE